MYLTLRQVDALKRILEHEADQFTDYDEQVATTIRSRGRVMEVTVHRPGLRDTREYAIQEDGAVTIEHPLTAQPVAWEPELPA